MKDKSTVADACDKFVQVEGNLRRKILNSSTLRALTGHRRLHVVIGPLGGVLAGAIVILGSTVAPFLFTSARTSRDVGRPEAFLSHDVSILRLDTHTTHWPTGTSTSETKITISCEI
jgi:hypothetical protein